LSVGDGIYVALSGAIAQSANLEVTAQNLANASTDGYQRVRPVFHEELARAGGQTAGFHYAQMVSSQNDTTRGPLRETGRSADFSMPEGTYLAVTTPRGERYTRAASLSTGIDGVVRTSHGDPVLSEDGRIIKIPTDPATPLRLDPTGQVYQGDETRGRLKLVTFAQPSMLSHDAGALLAATPEAGAPSASRGPIEVGTLEESNANVVTAMTDLMQASRTFEAFQRVIDTFRDADRSVVTNVPNSST
jgi:flagellar basal-body rod protein FlgF